MNLNKHIEFIDPYQINEEIDIIGCGAVGSTIAEQLARLGIKKIHLYDFDTVSEHNITNQMFFNQQIRQEKVVALKGILKLINPEIEVWYNRLGWKPGTVLSGYILLAVDDI